MDSPKIHGPIPLSGGGCGFFLHESNPEATLKQERESCSICGQKGNIRHCSRCANVSYCSVEHQKEDWKKHKKSCYPYKINVKGTRATRFPSDMGEMAEFVLELPDPCHLVWEFSRDLPPGSLVYAEKDVELLIAFRFESMGTPDRPGIPMSTYFMSRKFPYTSLGPPNCVVEAISAFPTEDPNSIRSVCLKGQISVRTSQAVKRGQLVSVDFGAISKGRTTVVCQKPTTENDEGFLLHMVKTWDGCFLPYTVLSGFGISFNQQLSQN